MIRHLLTIIWNERKINFWIVLEYIFVFTVLWFCCDYIFYMVRSYIEPSGYDINHVYEIQMSYDRKATNEISQYDLIQTFIERVKRHPDVEHISFSSAAAPYTGMKMGESMQVYPGEHVTNFTIRNIDREYLDVFRVKIESGRIMNFDTPNTNMEIMGSTNKEGAIGFFDGKGIFPKDIESLKAPVNEPYSRQIVGITEKVKDYFFGAYEPGLFVPLTQKELWGNTICIRIKPEAEKGFRDRFMKEMKEQLSVGPYTLMDVVSFKQNRKEYLKWNGIIDNINSISAITVFIIFNVFLGIISTFWYRTQSRKSEIGLRMALGSKRNGIHKMLITETLMLLFIASLISINLCIHIQHMDLLSTLGLPTSKRLEMGIGFEQDIFNYMATFIFLAIISLAGVWYPAYKAAQIQPADALRDE